MFWDVLYNLTVMPIQILIEFIFALMYRIFENPGVAIIFVSIAVQLLVLPLYKQSDAMQEQERQKQKQMERWVKHIKKTFKGDERFMMLQAYYREVGYKPAYAIKGSFSLLLQIPFFMAAYNYLSGLSILKEASFLGIADLSAPDGLIVLGGISLNLLPILMTVFNIISGIIYTKGFPVKDKVQTYGLAAVFLVLLYNSPAGLVFYWTLNNLFSLLKNIFMKVIKDPGPVINVIAALFGIAVFGSRTLYFINSQSGNAADNSVVCIVFLLICLTPSARSLFKAFRQKRIDAGKWKAKEIKEAVNDKDDESLFTFAGFFAALLLGAVIPVSVIGSSPTEFFSEASAPLDFVIRTLAVYVGFFVVWFRIFYMLCPDKVKRTFAVGLCGATIMGVVDFYGFSMNLGTMSTVLAYDEFPLFSLGTILLNLGILIFVGLVVSIIYNKKKVILTRICQIACLTLTVVCAVGCFNIINESSAYVRPKTVTAEESEDIYHLSRKGKNVIVFMVDRAISGYIPYFLQEKPELSKMYDGFTYYPNTLSFGGNTNFGAPALFGGYDYMPKAMNERDDLLLADKHNEALKLMPQLFGEKGYRVTITDPPYAGYRWNPDLSIYKGMKNVNAYITEGKYTTESSRIYKGIADVMQRHNFICYSFTKVVPVALHNFFYDGANYFGSNNTYQINPSFFRWYSGLETLSTLTDISDGEENNFLLLQNATAHEANLLKEPEYVPDVSSYTEYDPYDERFIYNGKRVDVSDNWDFCHYQINMCALLRIGEWLEYLKKEGVYDNTKIIIVADHGYPMAQFRDMLLSNGIDVERFNPLLMVKDFGAHGFNTSNDFMTNADVPTLAMDGVIDDPVNPNTGNPVNMDYKTSGNDMYITTSGNWSTVTNHGYKFDTIDGYWYAVKPGNILDVKNWKRVSKGDK